MAVPAHDLKHAVDLALAGDWDGAHAIAQRDDGDPMSCWLHACLHKIEGDSGNARYWYRRSGGHAFEAFTDVGSELAAIRAALA
jgi:hypothetical protein